MITLNMQEKNKGITISDKAFSFENNIVTLQIKVMDGDIAYDLTGKTITASFDKTGIETGILSVTDGLIQIPITNNLIKAGYNLIQLNFRWDTDKWEQSPIMTWNIHSSLKTTDISKETPDIVTYMIAELAKRAVKTVKVIGVIPTVADYICDGLRDDAELQQAIDDLSVLNGGKIKVLAGTYHYSKCVGIKSNISIEFENNSKIIMDSQVSAVITSIIEVGNTSVSVSSSNIDKFQVGMEVGFIPDSNVGYRAGEDACVITDIIDNTITFSTPATKQYLANVAMLVSLNSCLTAMDTTTTILQNIEIVGGDFDGNKANNPIWIRDMHQNGIITGGVHSLKLKNITVHDFNFQNIHVSGTMLSGDNRGTVLENCISYNSRASGITLDTVPEETLVINCNSYDNGNSGLQLVDVDKCTVMGGYYRNNGFCGVRSAHDEVPVYGNKFIGVTVDSNGRGFGIRNNVGTILNGCITKSNNEAGIYLEEDCKNTQLLGCVHQGESHGIIELASGTASNTIINPIFIECTERYSLSSAGLFGIEDNEFKTNKSFNISELRANRLIIDALNNHFQLAENRVTKWHAETVGGVFNLVESGVLERLIIAGNEANLQANLKVRQFGCNGKESQASATINSALTTDIITVDAAALNATNTLLNQIRAALINCGICT